MAYEELEKLVLALPSEEAVRLLAALDRKLGDTSVRQTRTPYFSGDDAGAVKSRLFEQFSNLPPARQAEVADFIAFLHHKERTQRADQDFVRAFEASFRRIWDNDDDALYDRM